MRRSGRAVRLLPALLAVTLGAVAGGCGTDDTHAPSDSSALDASPDGSVDATGDAGESALGRLEPPRTLAFCSGGTEAVYDPVAGGTLDSFPDDAWTRTAPGQATGLRVHVDDDTPWIDWLPGAFRAVFLDLNALDGFGVNADLFVRFAGPIGLPPSGTATAIGPTAVELWELAEGGAAQRVPFEARRIDDDATLLVSPMRPLRPKTRHALVVRASLADAQGGCLRPSARGRALLERRIEASLPADEQERMAGLTLRWQQALDAAGVQASEVAAVRVFTTQSTVDRSLAIAADIRERDVTWQSANCSKPKNKAWRLCEVEFDAWDYRDGLHIVDAKAHTLRRHVARVWLPETGDGPFPTVVFGHGLTGARDQGDKLADFAAPKGVAAIAIDAVYHGEHPAGAAKSLGGVLGFFGIDPAALTFDFLRLRDNFRQSTYEKLQLIEAMRRHPDFDGDGKVDFDVTKIGYLGVSLGGLMGPELLALSPDLRGAVLSVPGAKVSSIIQSSEQFAPIILAFKPESSTAGDVDRFFCVLQTLVDPGDAGSYAGHVLENRLPGTGTTAPDVLIQMAIGDDIVPNVATRALIRAFGMPVVGKVLQPVGLVQEGVALPVSANLAGGTRTAGAFQFDRIRSKADSPAKKADHSSTPASFEAMTQDLEFFETWVATGHGTIIDPFVETGTPPLP